MEKINLKALSKQELESFIRDSGLPSFRTRQLLNWIYVKYAQDIQDITEFSKELRESLSERTCISNLKLLDRQTSKDGTEKFLFELEDRETIESVLISDNERLTLCISSQVGCAMGCRFCLTGKLGLKRNLRPHEIVDQIISVSRIIKPPVIAHHPILTKGRSGDSLYKKITNVVLMGMGEPLANAENVVDALWRITGLMKMSPRRITLSTSGIAAKITGLPKKAPMVNLAISLNATTDEVRDYLMPINRIYPLKKLLGACRRFPLPARRKITFEYVLLKDINDTPEDAKRLISLLKGIPSKVNLIPFNAYDRAEFQRPDDESVLTFQDILTKGHILAFIRKSAGQDILAACGQLKARYKIENSK